MNKQNVRDLSRDEIKELQQKSLEILLYFDDFCRKHGLKYFLCGGCLIGAIRHHGQFIPWDDDIDVIMLRDDYEKLPILWNKYADVNRYSYCRTNDVQNYHNTAASIRDNNTTFINKHSVNDDINHGLQLDVIPVDNRAKDGVKRIWQIFWAMVYSLYNAQRLPDNQGKYVRCLARVLFLIIPTKYLQNKAWHFAEKHMLVKGCCSDFYGELVTGLHFMKVKYCKDIFASTTDIDFCGHKILAPADPDKYLRIAYGDYMKLPPVEKQTAKHNTVLIDTEHSYLDYKGKYYCVEK